ncbi:MAG: DUF4405 domain-containing protein [Gemmataceae bacterium]
MSTSVSEDVSHEHLPQVHAEVAKKAGSRAVLNFWLDAALFVAIIFIMWLSVMLQVIFPPGTAASGWRLWGMSYDQWRNVQFERCASSRCLASNTWCCTGIGS